MSELRVVTGPQEQPLNEAFDVVGEAISGFQYNRPHLFTGELPLGRDMSGGIIAETARLLGDVAGRSARAMLGEWATGWADGEIEHAESRNSSRTRARTIIAGPARERWGNIQSPAVEFDVHFRGRPDNPFALRNLGITVGLVNSEGQFTANLPIHLSHQSLCRWRDNLPQTMPQEQFAVAALARHSSKVITALHDPFRAALPQIYQGIAANPDQAATLLKWRRPSRTAVQNNAVEVCFVKADPAIYGPGRQAVFLRDSNHPEGPVLGFDEYEWEAFVGGAKDDEFDIEN